MSDSTPPERLAEREQPRAVADLDRRVAAACDAEAHHPAEPAHLARGDVVPGVRRRGPGRCTSSTLRVRLEQRLDERLGVVAVPLHAHRERPDAAQHEPRVERARRSRPSSSGACRAAAAIVVVARDRRAADDVAVPAQVLGRRVHDDVGPSASGCWRYGRREGVVDHEERARRRARARRSPRGRRSAASGSSASRSRRRASRPAASPPRSRRGRRRATGVCASPHGAEHLVDEPERPAVGVVGDDDVVARSCTARAAPCRSPPYPRRTRTRASRPRGRRGTARGRCASG